jgi:hypothetical protein
MSDMGGVESATAETVSESTSRRSWRDHLKIHPAAELFPMMSEPELRDLGEDIKANGMRVSIVLYKGKLLDGRNRLDAMELVGIKFELTKGIDPATRNKLSHLDACDGSNVFDSEAAVIDHFGGAYDFDPDADPYAYVVSANLHRRHLTGEQKRELIAKVLQAKPEASNRTIAKQITVAAVRDDLESTGEIPQLEKTVGADGKKRKAPAKKRVDEQEERDRNECAALYQKVLDAEQRAAGSAEVSIEERRAQNAALDEPAEVDEVDRRVSCVTNTILRHVDGLSRGDAQRFFAVLRDRLDEAEREALREA